jgi:hypothetical protein
MIPSAAQAESKKQDVAARLKPPFQNRDFLCRLFSIPPREKSIVGLKKVA